MQIALAPRTSFLDAIRQIAAEMLEGETVDARINWLASYFRQDRAAVRHQVDEMVELLRD